MRRVPDGGDDVDPGPPSLSVTRQGPAPRARSATTSREVSSKLVDKRTVKPPQQKLPARRPQARRSSGSSDDSRVASDRAAIMPKGTGSVKHGLLPPIIASLKARYLATLCSALYASEEPFDHFTKTSPEFLYASRQAFQHVWPHLNITLETDDMLFSIVILFIIIIITTHD